MTAYQPALLNSSGGGYIVRTHRKQKNKRLEKWFGVRAFVAPLDPRFESQSLLGGSQSSISSSTGSIAAFCRYRHPCGVHIYVQANT